MQWEQRSSPSARLADAPAVPPRGSVVPSRSEAARRRDGGARPAGAPRGGEPRAAAAAAAAARFGASSATSPTSSGRGRGRGAAGPGRRRCRASTRCSCGASSRRRGSPRQQQRKAPPTRRGRAGGACRCRWNCRRRGAGCGRRAGPFRREPCPRGRPIDRPLDFAWAPGIVAATRAVIHGSLVRLPAAPRHEHEEEATPGCASASPDDEAVDDLGEMAFPPVALRAVALVAHGCRGPRSPRRAGRPLAARRRTCRSASSAARSCACRAAGTSGAPRATCSSACRPPGRSRRLGVSQRVLAVGQRHGAEVAGALAALPDDLVVVAGELQGRTHGSRRHVQQRLRSAPSKRSP